MLYRVNEVAKELRVHPVTVREWISQGRVKAVKVGSTWRISQEELDRLKKGGV